MESIGIILAGGQSSRMEQDKALLRIEHQTMLERTQHTLSQTSVIKVVISRNNDNYLSDLVPHKGPLSGIHSAAMRFPRLNLLVVPVDLPFIDSQSLQKLIDVGNESHCNSRYQQHSLPLYLHNTQLMRRALDYTLRCSSRFSVHHFCSHFPLTELTLSQPDNLLNTNTPEQWHQAMRYQRNERPESNL